VYTDIIHQMNGSDSGIYPTPTLQLPIRGILVLFHAFRWFIRD